MRIRDAVGPAEYPRLEAIWRSAVDATHGFLAEADRADIEGQLADTYFPAVRLTVAEIDGVPVGFAGTAGEQLEMLFVHADARGRGVGSALLGHAIAEQGIRVVDVNEQNEQAVEFYLRRGFVVVGRSELDDAGRPYPLLQMEALLTPVLSAIWTSIGRETWSGPISTGRRLPPRCGRTATSICWFSHAHRCRRPSARRWSRCC